MGEGKYPVFQEETIYERIKTLVIFFFKKNTFLVLATGTQSDGEEFFWGWGWGKECGERPDRTALLIVRKLLGIQKCSSVFLFLFFVFEGWG